MCFLLNEVSDAVQMQREWSFARTPPLLSGLYRRVSAQGGVQDLLHGLWGSQKMPQPRLSVAGPPPGSRD